MPAPVEASMAEDSTSVDCAVDLLAARMTAVCGGLSCLFFAAHVGVMAVVALTGHDSLLGLVTLFNLNSELSLSTWYSSLALAFSGLLLFVIYRAKLARRDPFLRHWLGLALVFVFLSADEAASIHERFAEPLRRYVSTFGLEFGQWTAVYGPLVLIFFLAYLPFVRSLWPRPGMNFVTAGAVFVTGALVLELVGAVYYTTVLNGLGPELVSGTQGVFGYQIIAGAEDLLEMLGVVLWMRALLTYMSDEKISLRLMSEEGPSDGRA
jgi:hypothetical protein